MAKLEDKLDDLLASSWARAGAATRDSWPIERRLDGSKVARVLRSRKYAVLSTTRADGRPHAAPVSFAIADDCSIWLPTTSGAVRVANLAEQPAASFILCEGEDERHLAVLIEGLASSLSVGEAKVEAATAGVSLAATAWITSWIWMRPSRVLAYAAAEADLSTA